jgi:hypothetical protein
MTRAQTVMDLLGSLHTLQLDSAWMMRLPVARRHLSGFPVPRGLLLRLSLAEWLASSGRRSRETWGDERDTAGLDAQPSTDTMS